MLFVPQTGPLEEGLRRERLQEIVALLAALFYLLYFIYIYVMEVSVFLEAYIVETIIYTHNTLSQSPFPVLLTKIFR